MAADYSQLIKQRVQAKADLYAFLLEVSSQVSLDMADREDAADEIARAATLILSPHFSPAEMPMQLQDLFQTLLMAEPRQKARNNLNTVMQVAISRLK